VKTIIFDLGNVIAFFDHRRGLEKLRPFSPLTVEEMYASVYAGEVEDRIERGLVNPATYLGEVHKLWRLRCDPEYLGHVLGDVFWANPETCELVPRLRERYRILLGSNTNAVHARRFLKQFGDVFQHFHHLVLSYEIGFRKPDADFYHACQRYTKAKASECVFIDDLAANIEGARNFGFQAIHYQPNDGLAGRLAALGVFV
jgi:putative hydrolase of the HAD superfamily